MSNPAPTLNQINAFNATQGTTIDFNIIGGTELVRSNRIYIYDLSDNSLICTHLYVSTESIHELPANTDSSIVYESGKSSADFVNGAQYYAQIQTYTDTAGTQGGSGLSVAKMFWCLVDPTLTITTIPSTISTTSYNVSATYTDTSASVVSNIIQQYQFNLYSAVGSLLQSSGVVVGSGTQQGTSDAYDISYNFTGLNVGSSYYVTVEVTTTQGMSVSAQSGTFTVSIDTPTLGEATVVNNACDGYISVTSNLSGEYGGSASGEIASFVTNSVNNISSLKVDIDPLQDLHGYDKPWVGGAGKNLFIPFGGTSRGITFTLQDDGTVKISGTMTSGGWPQISKNFTLAELGLSVGDTIYCYAPTDSDVFAAIRFFDSDGTQLSQISINNSGTIPANTVTVRLLQIGKGGNDAPQQGDTINTVGKFEFLKGSSAPTSWTPYSNICPITGWTEINTERTGVNVWDEEWEVGSIGTSDGQNTNSSTLIRSKNYVPVIPNATYYAKAPASSGGNLFFYDADKNYLSYVGFAVNTNYTIPSNARYVRFRMGSVYGTTYNNDISINYPSTDTEYHAYQGTTYPVSWQTEAGTVYGGTVDLVSGVLTVDRAIRTFDGTESAWEWPSTRPIIRLLDMKEGNSMNGLANWLPTVSDFDSFGIRFGYGNKYIYICQPTTLPSVTDLASFKTYLGTHNLTVCYPLAQAQTYQLTPTQIQTLVGANNVWSDAGDVEITYNIPITNLLVKRQDVADISGDWLTLYSQPITQASDMDFTFIDFLNQYGKTYKYALVPLLTQTQSGVEVEVEGGYTVSDEVQSIFDGVFIADSTGSQKCKANVGYGNVDMNQVVGSITPIGAQYPIIITNSQNQYHNGSISGTIVPDDYYFNGNLSRIDMVNKRSELEQFLTNKRAKIIKDWNGNIWLIMIMDNVSCTFNNNYGMGIVNFSTSWVEVGDPTNQEDLQATGLINIGGV